MISQQIILRIFNFSYKAFNNLNCKNRIPIELLAYLFTSNFIIWLFNSLYKWSDQCYKNVDKFVYSIHQKFIEFLFSYVIFKDFFLFIILKVYKISLAKQNI